MQRSPRRPLIRVHKLPGRSPGLVFIHGAPDSYLIWLPYLSESFAKGRAVYLIDFPSNESCESHQAFSDLCASWSVVGNDNGDREVMARMKDIDARSGQEFLSRENESLSGQEFSSQENKSRSGQEFLRHGNESRDDQGFSRPNIEWSWDLNASQSVMGIDNGDREVMEGTKDYDDQSKQEFLARGQTVESRNEQDCSRLISEDIDRQNQEFSRSMTSMTRARLDDKFKLNYDNSPRPSPTLLDGITDRLGTEFRKVLDELESESFGIVAHDFGAAFVWKWMELDPRRAKRVEFFATMSVGPEPRYDVFELGVLGALTWMYSLPLSLGYYLPPLGFVADKLLRWFSGYRGVKVTSHSLYWCEF